MSGLAHCAVDGCSSIGGSGMSFFRCPLDELRCQRWKEVLGFTGIHKYANITLKESYNRIKICSSHFSDDCFTNTSRKHLTKLAIPSLNLGLTSSSQDGNNRDANKRDVCTQTEEMKIANVKCQTDETQTVNMECQTVHTTQNDKSIQVDARLSVRSPRKAMLKERIKSLEKQVKSLEHKNQAVSTSDINLTDVLNFCEKNYPEKAFQFA